MEKGIISNKAVCEILCVNVVIKIKIMVDIILYQLKFLYFTVVIFPTEEQSARLCLSTIQH